MTNKQFPQSQPQTSVTTGSRQPMAVVLAVLATLLLANVGCRPTNTASTHSEQTTAAAISDSDDGADDPQPSDHSADQPVATESASGSAAEFVLHPSLLDRRYDVAIQEVTNREDPVLDGWDSERDSQLVDKQLKVLGKWLSGKIDDVARLKAVCTPDVTGTALRPRQLTTAFTDHTLAVRRGHPSETFHGVAQLQKELEHQSSWLVPGPQTHYKFKIIRVQRQGDTLQTVAYFQFAGHALDHPQRRAQVGSTWTCRWHVSAEPANLPKLAHLSVTDYEESESRTDQPLFTDVTRSQLGSLNCLDTQLVHGRDYWYGNLEAAMGVEGRGNGLAIGDANGDGLDDIYVCQPAAIPNLLLLRRPDGQLIDVSHACGVDWLDSTRGALLVDLDNDGDQDLVLTQASHIVLHENIAQSRSEVKYADARVLTTDSRLFSLNAVDFDSDGDLDLFVCGYSSTGQTRPEDIFASPVPYHDANNGAPNLLLRNDGKWDFTNVTDAVGLDVNNLKFSLASTWADYDNDGDMDLYVANDFGRNNLYQNQAGRFVDVAADAGVEDIGPGMSACWGDYDNDGWVDLYVSNMFSSAGSRITHNQKFKPGASEVDLAGFRRHARGNSLFRNQGDGTFSDQSLQSATTMGRWAWGSMLLDINNDGRRDVYVANGFVTADNQDDL